MTYQIDPGKLIDFTRVYYEDGPQETMNWDTLPQDGVILVVVFRTDGSRRTLPIKDYYFQTKGLHDEIFGSTDDLRSILRYQSPVILFGKWTDDATMTAIELAARYG